MTRLHRLHVRGYRQLVGQFEFGVGLTLVSGANESGKSTLHDAISATMFGLSPEQRRQSRRGSGKERRRPWGGGPYGATLVLDDTHGRRLRVEWDFSADVVRVLDDATGVEVHSRREPKQREDWGLEQFIGIPRSQHEQLCLLAQGDLGTVSPDGTLRHALQEAVERAASGERAVEEADGSLRLRLAELGVHGGHYKPTASGRLARFRESVQTSQSAIAVAEGDRLAIEELARDEAAERERLAEARRRVLADEQAVLLERAARAQSKLENAEVVIARSTATPTEAAALLPEDLPGRVDEARNRWEALQRELERATRAQDDDAPSVSAARAQLREAEYARDELRSYSKVDDVHAARVEQLVGELGRIALAEPLPTASSPPVGAGSRHGLVVVLAGGLLVCGLALGVLVTPIGFGVAALGAVAGLVAGLRRSEPGSAGPLTVPSDDPRTGERGRIVSDLNAVLGLEPREDPVPPAQRYLADARRRQEFLAAELEVRAQSEALRLFESSMRACDEAATAAREQTRVLRRLLLEVGIETDEVQEGLRVFEQRRASQKAQLERAQQRVAAENELLGLLDGQTIDELRSVAASYECEHNAHVDANGVLDGGTPDDEALARRRAKSTELHAAVADIAARRQAREERADDLADLALELATAQAEVDSIEREANAIRLARETLKEAAVATHRHVAPHLNEALRSTLPMITRGRYSGARVSDDLTIRVDEVATGSIVEVEELSRGTRDQIALIQRLALSTLLDPAGGTTPLLLDDCFARTDRFRLPAAINLLAEHALHRQVLIFTDDPSLVETVRAADPGATVIELEDPAASKEETHV